MKQQPSDSRKQTLDPEGTPEWEEGRAAYRAGEPNDTNPYRSHRGFNGNRFRWFVGWYDEKTAHKFGKIQAETT